MALEPWLDDAPLPAEGPVVQTLADRAKRALHAAASRPGRVRRSAFDLLAADALLTYACEAALEAADPEQALNRLLSDSASL
jgi:hypothetical protein